jgi:hypothetical protein
MWLVELGVRMTKAKLVVVIVPFPVYFSTETIATYTKKKF